MTATTAPKGRPTPKRIRQRNLAPTMNRRMHMQDHMPPDTGVWLPNQHAVDRRLWHGHSKMTNRPARRRANRKSWTKILRAARQEFMASKRDAADVELVEALAEHPWQVPVIKAGLAESRTPRFRKRKIVDGPAL